MKVMDGLTATRTIRAWEKANGGRTTPIIASALKADRKICLAAGCTAYLNKPVKQEVQLRAIRDHVRAGHRSDKARTVPRKTPPAPRGGSRNGPRPIWRTAGAT
jgi:DNA-binding response OmpR family regulator